MAQVDVYNQKAEVVKTTELADEVFGIEPNQQAIYDAVLVYQAGLRQGTHSTKTRGEVSGTGKKPFRQKGTGRARQGSTRSPQWYHGGIVFAPKPRDYRFSVNKKVRRLAMKSAFSAKAQADEIIVIDKIALDEIKTAKIAAMLSAVGSEKKALIVLPEVDEKVIKSARNIEGVKTAQVNELNVYDILNAGKLIISKDALTKIEEVYA